MGNNCLQSVQVSMAGDEEVEDTFGHHSEPTDVNDAKYNKTRKCRAELPITLHEIALLEKSWITVGKEWDKICTSAFLRYKIPC